MPESQLGLALTRLTSPEGWLESVEAGQPFSVWIDGAREAQSARETLETARAQVSGHLWVVVGGRADQDAKARHALGRAVAKFADVTMLTSDNPGRQSQTALMEEVGRAIPSDCQVWIEERSGAIRWVIRRMRSTDGLVVLGKGRRSRQDLGDVVLPFDDATHVRAALAERGHVGGF
jgi:UDP-N-acetylmuramoyl-L-alanyl-D-glutamate--2,6-diaminopimelate ligase